MGLGSLCYSADVTSFSVYVQLFLIGDTKIPLFASPAKSPIVDACSGCAGDYENPDLTAPGAERGRATDGIDIGSGRRGEGDVENFGPNQEVVEPRRGPEDIEK
jgi:hypothetical protein